MTRNPKPRTLPLGEVSSGTTRPEDIAPELLWLADQVRMSREDRNAVRSVARRALHGNREQTEEALGVLYDILNLYAPPFCYVGSHLGDGACIGVWVSDEVLESVYLNDEVQRSSEPGAPDDGSEFRLYVNDHGNATLYDRRGREIWSVV